MLLKLYINLDQLENLSYSFIFSVRFFLSSEFQIKMFENSSPVYWNTNNKHPFTANS